MCSLLIYFLFIYGLEQKSRFYYIQAYEENEWDDIKWQYKQIYSASSIKKVIMAFFPQIATYIILKKKILVPTVKTIKCITIYELNFYYKSFININ